MAAEHSPELLALLQACKEAPEDDTPRLVLADWLEDHGFADRAACVRLSRRLVREEVDSPLWLAWRDELNDPRREAGRWLAPLRERFGRVDFHDGLLRIRLDWEELAALEMDSIPPEYLPWLETVHFTSYVSDESLEQVAARNSLSPFTSLEFETALIENGELEEMFQGPESRHFAHVTQMNFHDCIIDDEGVQEMVTRHTQLPSLRVLDLSDNAVWEDGVSVLATSPLLGQLTSLNLVGVDLDEDTPVLLHSPALGRLVNLRLGILGKAEMKALVESPYLRNLRSLHIDVDSVAALKRLEHWPADRGLDRFVLSGAMKSVGKSLAKSALLRTVTSLAIEASELDAKGVSTLLAGLPGPRLTHLSFNSNSIPGAGAALAECAALACLRELDLRHTALDVEDIQALARSPHLRGLEVLHLTGTRLGAGGLQALVTGTIGGKKGLKDAIDPFPNLRVLSLANTQPTKRGVEYFVGARLLSRLEFLDLALNRVVGLGQLLGASPNCAKLRHLALDDCQLGDDDLVALAKSSHFSGLLSLSLNNNKFTNAGLRALVKSQGFTELTALSMTGNNLTNPIAKPLLAWRPGEWARLDISGQFSSTNWEELRRMGVLGDW